MGKPSKKPLPVEYTGFSEKIREARKAMGYTLDDMAQLVGVNISMVSQYESGRYALKFHMALRIMALLDMPMTDIDHSEIDALLKRAAAYTESKMQAKELARLAKAVRRRDYGVVR